MNTCTHKDERDDERSHLYPYQPTEGEDYMSDAQLAHFRTILKTGVKN